MGYFAEQYYKPINDFIEYLAEAHVVDTKYGPGTSFVVKADKFQTFNNKLKAAGSSFVLTADNNLWEKISDEPKSVTTLNFGSEKEFTFIKNVKEPKVILRIEGNNGSSLMFNRIKNVAGMNWSAETLETAAAIGLKHSFYNELKLLAGNKKLSALPNEVAIKNTVKSELNTKSDWNQKGRSAIVASLDNIAYVDIIQLMLLSEGMHRFYEERVKKYIQTPHFVHGQIAKFYEIERKQFKTDGVKENTADLLITSVPADTFLSELSKVNNVESDKKTGVCTIPNTDIKFVLCSLKKSADGGQLGKITSLIIDMFAIPSYDQIAGFALEENAKGVGTKILDTLKSFGKAVYDQIVKVIGYIKKLPNLIVADLNKMFGSQFDKDTKFLEAELGLETGSLSECFAFATDSILAEASKQTVQKTLNDIAADKAKATKLINNVNKRYEELLKLSKKYKDSIFVTPNAALPADADGLSFGDITKLLVNFTSFYVFKTILTKNLSSKETSSLIHALFMIQKEMLFGKTQLPLYKVYGLKSVSDSEHTYEYLGLGADFVKSKMTSAVSKYNKLIIAIRCNKQNDKYFAIDSFILSGINTTDDNTVDMQYNVVRTGSNQGDTKFTFVVEGTKTVSLEYIEKNVINKKA